MLVCRLSLKLSVESSDSYTVARLMYDQICKPSVVAAAAKNTRPVCSSPAATLAGIDGLLRCVCIHWCMESTAGVRVANSAIASIRFSSVG